MSREDRLQKLAELQAMMNQPKEKSGQAEAKQEIRPPEIKESKEPVQIESKSEEHAPDSPDKKPIESKKRKAQTKNKSSKKKTIQRLMEPHYLSKVPKLRQETPNSSDSDLPSDTETEDSEEEIKSMPKKELQKQFLELKRMFHEQASTARKSNHEFKKYKRPKEHSSNLFPSTTSQPSNVAFRYSTPNASFSRPAETVASFGPSTSNRYRFI